jgi:RNA polymerase sigma-70 factor (ECF subfamily)
MDGSSRGMAGQSQSDDDDLIPTRASLLGRLKDLSDQVSWRQFFDVYWKLIYSTARSVRLTPAEAEDVVQETMIAVWKNIGKLDYDPTIGSFKSWLLTLTRRRIMDHFRKRYREPLTVSLDQVPDREDPAIESFWEAAWEANLVGAAIERVKGRVDPKQFQIFELYVLKEWPVRRIIDLLGVSATLVYVTKHRVSAQVRKQYKALARGDFSAGSPRGS